MRGVAVLRADGANARGVAELTIAQVFALARGTVAADAAMKRGAWERGAAGVEIDGKILGIIGCGSIGKLVARMALGCGMKILAFDPSPDAFDPGPAFRFRPFDEVVASADFLSLHCPPAPDGRPVLDASALSRMKRGAFLINTARYDVFDAAAVLAALDSCHLGAVALDAFDSEPPRDTRLPRHPRVLATPHTGGFTRESIDRTMAVAVENLRRSLLATPR